LPEAERDLRGVRLFRNSGLPPAATVRRTDTAVCLRLRRSIVPLRRSASGYDGPSYRYDGLPPATTVRRTDTAACLRLRRSVVPIRRSASGYDGSSYRYDALPPATTVRRTDTTLCLRLRRFVVPLRRFASGYDGLSYRYGGLPPAATVRRTVTAVCLRLRWSVVPLRWSASAYDDPPPATAVRRTITTKQKGRPRRDAPGTCGCGGRLYRPEPDSSSMSSSTLPPALTSNSFSTARWPGRTTARRWVPGATGRPACRSETSEPVPTNWPSR